MHLKVNEILAQVLHDYLERLTELLHYLQKENLILGMITTLFNIF